MKLAYLVCLFPFVLCAQTSLKIDRPANYDANCVLEVCEKNGCYTDSISKNIFLSENNLELRVNGICTVKKKFDVFVSSFEISMGESKNVQVASAQSSFFNDFQKKLIQQLHTGESFTIKNIVVHAPDNFRKMDDIQIKLY